MPPVSNQPNTPSPQITPPKEQILASIEKQSPKSAKFPKFLTVFSLILIIVVGGLGIGYLFIPKVFSSQFSSQLKPQILTLKSSTQAVRDSINKIHFSVTAQNDPTQQEGLRTSGLLIHPQISSLQVSNVLGVSEKKVLGPLEEAVDTMRLHVSNGLKQVNSQSNIAGTTTGENPSIVRFRQIKDTTQVTNVNITKAEQDLTALKTQIDSRPILLLTEQTNKTINPNNLATIQPYFDEAQKVSRYYDSLSDTLISMNLKINSFKTSLASSTTTFSKLSQTGLNNANYETILTQTQTFLNQAKTDATELKNLTENLKKLPNDSLPTASDSYHQHNIKVLGSVTTYFDTQSTIMQSFIDATKTLTTKAQKTPVTTADINNYKTIITNGSNKAVVSDTQFASDLQSLVGEENSLTLSFWQNNAILSKGEQAEQEITNFQKSVESL